MYKMIVSDMDGTLLNSFGQISKKNKDAIKKVISRGIEFVIVTGRPYSSVKDLLKYNDIKCNVIGCNGAQITDNNGKLIKAYYIDKKSLIKMIEIAEKNKVYYQIYDDNYIYTKSRIELLKILKNYPKNLKAKKLNVITAIIGIIRGINRLFFSEVIVKKDMLKFVNSMDIGFYKIQLSSLDTKLLSNIREIYNNIPNISITSSAFFNFEVSPCDITKGSALEEFAKLKNIKREEIMAFGDNYNDISMLEYAGYAVAVDNAVEEVKKKAHLVTLSNDNDGFSYVINQKIR